MHTRITALARRVGGRVIGRVSREADDTATPPGTANALVATGRVRLTTHDIDRVREAYPEWDDLAALEEVLGERFRDQPDPLDAARIAALDELRPDDVFESGNTQLEVFHENIVDVVDPNQSVSAIDASHLALGDDGSSTAYGDTGLTNEIYREGVDSTTDNGNDLKTSTLLAEDEGNGNTYRELGLVSASTGGTFFNHSLIEARTKTNEETMTFEVVLQFRAA